MDELCEYQNARCNDKNRTGYSIQITSRTLMDWEFLWPPLFQLSYSLRKYRRITLCPPKIYFLMYSKILISQLKGQTVCIFSNYI